MKYIRAHWKKLLGILGVCLILAVSYWYGGNAPGSRGFVTLKNEKETTEEQGGTQYSEPKTQTEEQNPAEAFADRGDTSSSDTEQPTETDSIVSGGGAADGAKKREQATEQHPTEQTADEQPTESITAEQQTTTEQQTGTEQQTTTEQQAGTEQQTTTEQQITTEQSSTAETAEEHTCTISINCSNIKKNWELFDTGKADCVPTDGWILKETKVTFQKGDTVFDVLKDITKKRAIHMEYSFTALYGSYYIEGIGNLYEFDCGELSGWEYSVNGEFPSFGCSKYVLQDGDKIEWKYTCDLGADVGNPYEEENE